MPDVALGCVDVGLHAIHCLVGHRFCPFLRRHVVIGLAACLLGIGGRTVPGFMDRVTHVVNGSFENISGLVDRIFFHDVLIVPATRAIESGSTGTNLGKKLSMAGLANLIWTLIVILVVLWLIGFLLHIGGGLIHLILVVAVILLIVNLLTGRGARV